MSVSQKDSVVNEVKAILGASYNKDIPVDEQLTVDQFKFIKANIVNGILNGTIDFSKDITDQKAITKYVSGMVSNYLRKAKELNGGIKYEAQATNDKSHDYQVIELNKLLKIYIEGSNEYTQILTAIESRKQEIIAEKSSKQEVKKKTKELDSINMEVLPESLKNLANLLANQISK